MRWHQSFSCDPRARAVADRHYNRQSVGSPKFTPPGRCFVLVTPRDGEARAVWVTSWPYAEYTKHAWAGAWINSCFRKEEPGRASDYIREAVAATRSYWPTPPSLGMVTFVDPKKVQPVSVRGQKVHGYCYQRAGFKHVGFTKGGLWAWQMLPHEMPEAIKPNRTAEAA